MRTRVKICGITRSSDAQRAAELGADAIGLVFYARSPRAVEVAAAAALLEDLPAFVSRVGLFVNPRPEEVTQVLEAVPLDLLQFHGEEEAALCRRFGRPYIKALRVRERGQVAAALAAYPDAAALLLDAWHPAAHGGTGECFDWGLIPADCPRPLILAGGLNPDNVATAIARVRPYAVDVSSGVEASHGIKDAEKLREFFTGVLSADVQSRTCH